MPLVPDPARACWSEAVQRTCRVHANQKCSMQTVDTTPRKAECAMAWNHSGTLLCAWQAIFQRGPAPHTASFSTCTARKLGNGVVTLYAEGVMAVRGRLQVAVPKAPRRGIRHLERPPLGERPGSRQWHRLLPPQMRPKPVARSRDCAYAARLHVLPAGEDHLRQIMHSQPYQ